MNRLCLTIAVCALLIVPLMGASPLNQAASTPRDLSANDAALQAVSDANTAWGAKVVASDAARAAYDQALADLTAALADEATARTDLETAQTGYMTAYGDVPKEGTLQP